MENAVYQYCMYSKNMKITVKSHNLCFNRKKSVYDDKNSLNKIHRIKNNLKEEETSFLKSRWRLNMYTLNFIKWDLFLLLKK
jgi:hypothetical protein